MESTEALAAAPFREPSATEPDWSREAKRLWQWVPSRSLLASIRAYQRHAGSTSVVDRALRNVAILRHRFWSAVTGADIPLNCRIGGGLLMPHPNGIVFHSSAVLGPNCIVFQQVTLAADRRGAPTLGGHVDVGAGAKVLGGVTLGNDSRIGANAVVMTDVPAGATAVGIPARVVERG